MKINKLMTRLGVGALLVASVTVAANPAYAKANGKGNGNKKIAATEQPSNDAGSTVSENPFRSCSTDILGKVTGAIDCTISNLFSQDSVSPNKPLTVNQGEGFFGHTDWNFGGKIGTGNYKGDGNGQSGDWDLSKAIENNLGDIMLVFKSGKGTQLVGYELADGVESGTWDSPYVKGAFDFNGNNTKDVSHISVYYRQGKKEVKRRVPEPTSILGLAAISGLAASSLKRKRKTSNI